MAHLWSWCRSCVRVLYVHVLSVRSVFKLACSSLDQSSGMCLFFRMNVCFGDSDGSFSSCVSIWFFRLDVIWWCFFVCSLCSCCMRLVGFHVGVFLSWRIVRCVSVLSNDCVFLWCSVLRFRVFSRFSFHLHLFSVPIFLLFWGLFGVCGLISVVT